MLTKPNCVDLRELCDQIVQVSASIAAGQSADRVCYLRASVRCVLESVVMAGRSVSGNHTSCAVNPGSTCCSGSTAMHLALDQVRNWYRCGPSSQQPRACGALSRGGTKLTADGLWQLLECCITGEGVTLRCRQARRSRWSLRAHNCHCE
jgi:hypothetical protein